MVDPKYCVKCLRLGFERYRRYSKLPISIKVSETTVSFYVNKTSTLRGKNTRVSDHHPNLQHYTDGGKQPWLFDNISIEFIVPRSKEDKRRFRARVGQNASGTIKPFDVTTYQYDSTIIDSSDLNDMFNAIVVFLNGGGYSDPFMGTAKQAKVLSRHSNIKPYKAPAIPTNISVDSNNNNRIASQNGYGADYVSENKQYNKNNNMKQTIKLTESELRNVITESVKRVLNEAFVPKGCPYCGNPFKSGDNYCSKCGRNIQEIVNNYNSWLKRNNINQEPMQWPTQQPQGQQQMQQPMQQMQQQSTQQPMQQPTNTNNNTMIDNQIQQQMQRNMALQQQKAQQIRNRIQNRGNYNPQM